MQFQEITTRKKEKAELNKGFVYKYTFSLYWPRRYM